jgi:hypothetical protein
METTIGIEPMLGALQAPAFPLGHVVKVGSPGEILTRGLLVRSQVLYSLSYGAMEPGAGLEPARLSSRLTKAVLSPLSHPGVELSSGFEPESSRAWLRVIDSNDDRQFQRLPACQVSRTRNRARDTIRTCVGEFRKLGPFLLGYARVVPTQGLEP